MSFFGILCLVNFKSIYLSIDLSICLSFLVVLWGHLTGTTDKLAFWLQSALLTLQCLVSVLIIVFHCPSQKNKQYNNTMYLFIQQYTLESF